MTLASSATVKAKAFKSGYAASAEASATLTITQPFAFNLSNSGDKSVVAGSSVINSISTTLSSGAAQPVSFSVSGLPSGATGSFSSASCSPTCSSTLTIATSGSTSTGNFPITVTSTGGGLTKTTAFSLAVNAAAPPTNNWSFCALEDSLCNFSGTKEVRYGTNGVYVSNVFTNGTLCANSVFGDPVYGYGKQCEYRDVSPSFDFAVSNSGNKSVIAGSSVANSVSATLVSGSAQPVSFSASGLPSGATASFSVASCTPAARRY